MVCERRTRENVVILMPDKHMGNVVVALQAVSALRQVYEHARLSLVVDAAYRDIAEAMDGLNEVLLYPRRQLSESRVVARIGMFAGFVRRLRALEADLVVDLEGRQVSSVLTGLIGSPVRVGRASAKWSFIYTRKVVLQSGVHKIHNYLDIVTEVAGRPATGKVRLRVAERHRSSLGGILDSKGVGTGRQILCFHPGAGKIYKQWTPAGFAEVAQWLSGEDYEVVFIGGKAEVNTIRTIQSLAGCRVVNLGGELSLGELMALLERSVLFLGNDSGPMHLAAALGTPVVGLFGPADEQRWRPLVKRNIVLRGAERCGECMRGRCEHGFQCIQALTPGDVTIAIRELLHE